MWYDFIKHTFFLTCFIRIFSILSHLASADKVVCAHVDRVNNKTYGDFIQNGLWDYLLGTSTTEWDSEDVVSLKASLKADGSPLIPLLLFNGWLSTGLSSISSSESSPVLSSCARSPAEFLFFRISNAACVIESLTFRNRFM